MPDPDGRPRPRIYVAGMGPVSPMAFSQEAAVAPSVKQGTYGLRLNELGLPVEHDLGSFDYDWIGWG